MFIIILLYEQVIFLELIKFNNTYSEKLQSSKQNEKELITLAWKVKELTELNDNGRKLHSDINHLINKIEQGRHLQVQENIPSQLMMIRQKLVSFIKGVTRHQRTPATHILVFMISTEDRGKKPYALPVQCVPYKGLSDSKVRDLANSVIQEMVKRKMKVAGMYMYTQIGCLLFIDYTCIIILLGFTTDGEWNSLRTKGNTRPLSVFQIRANVRAKYSHISLKKLLRMITFSRISYFKAFCVFHLYPNYV